MNTHTRSETVTDATDAEIEEIMGLVKKLPEEWVKYLIQWEMGNIVLVGTFEESGASWLIRSLQRVTGTWK